MMSYETAFYLSIVVIVIITGIALLYRADRNDYRTALEIEQEYRLGKAWNESTNL